MKTLLAFVVATLFAACSETVDPAGNNPPPPLSAVHDTIAMDNPPVATGTLAYEYAARLSMFGSNAAVELSSRGVRTGLDHRLTASSVRVGDSSRVWFEAADVPFSPYTLTYNGTLAGDSIVGWARSTNRRDGGRVHRAMTLRRLY